MVSLSLSLSQLQSYGDALRLQQPLPSAPDAAIGGLLATMDADCERKQDQVTSLIVITEAALGTLILLVTSYN